MKTFKMSLFASMAIIGLGFAGGTGTARADQDAGLGFRCGEVAAQAQSDLGPPDNISGVGSHFTLQQAETWAIAARGNAQIRAAEVHAYNGEWVVFTWNR
jgi:hypothetical protein